MEILAYGNQRPFCVITDLFGLWGTNDPFLLSPISLTYGEPTTLFCHHRFYWPVGNQCPFSVITVLFGLWGTNDPFLSSPILLACGEPMPLFCYHQFFGLWGTKGLWSTSSNLKTINSVYLSINKFHKSSMAFIRVFSHIFGACQCRCFLLFSCCGLIEGVIVDLQSFLDQLMTKNWHVVFSFDF